MIQKHLLLLFLLFVLANVSYSQTKNRLDASGRKQGYWEAVDSRGALVYTGYFVDDKPVGELKRYFPMGGVRVIMNYDSTSTKAHARFFWQSGNLAARGNYVDTKRDSVWLYYSNQSKALSRSVEYADGKLNGTEQKFYPDGRVAEEINWKNGLKNGVWKQFFRNGQLKSTATYVNDKLDGEFMTYFSDGTKHVEGVYRQDIPDGEWKRYDEKGKLLSTIRYAGGTITNPEEVEAAEREFFRKVLEQEGNIKEPTIEDFMFGIP